MFKGHSVDLSHEIIQGSITIQNMGEKTNLNYTKAKRNKQLLCAFTISSSGSQCGYFVVNQNPEVSQFRYVMSLCTWPPRK